MKRSYLFRTREIPSDWLNKTPYVVNSLLVIETTAIPGLFFAIKVNNSGVAFDVIILSAKLIRAINYSLWRLGS